MLTRVEERRHWEFGEYGEYGEFGDEGETEFDGENKKSTYHTLAGRSFFIEIRPLPPFLPASQLIERFEVWASSKRGKCEGKEYIEFSRSNPSRYSCASRKCYYFLLKSDISYFYRIYRMIRYAMPCHLIILYLSAYN